MRIAAARDPTALPSTDRILFYDDRTITIYDGFAKAKYHFLVLPRIPFKLSTSRGSSSQQAAPTLSASNGRLNFGASSSNVVPASHMMSISSLLASPHAAEVLEAVHKASDRVLEHIRTDMMKQYGVTWEVERAFHAVPSMEHLHLHVVSMDLVSDRLKHKKHYLSFQPNVGFAIRLNVVEDLVKQGKKRLPKSEEAYEQLLKGPLMSHHTGQDFRWFPELKAHLESYWRERILTGSKAAAGVETETKGDGGSVSPTQQRPPQRRKIEPSGAVSQADNSHRALSDSEDEPSLPLKRH